MICNYVKRYAELHCNGVEVRIKNLTITILKTETIRALASFLDVPYTIADTSSITSSGYVGRDAQDVLKDLLDAAEGDIEKAQRGIIFLDECDKIKKTSGKGGGKDVNGEGVQQALLRLIEGGTHKVVKNRQTDSTIDFNTDKLIFAFGDSFKNYYAINFTFIITAALSLIGFYYLAKFMLKRKIELS